MPELLGWWTYVISVPLCSGALLTLFSLGGKGRKGGRAKGKTPKVRAMKTAAKAAPTKVGPTKAAPGKSAPAKVAKRQTRAAELPPLFLLQNFLLLWSVAAVVVTPLHPQNASATVLALILGAMVVVSGALLAGCAGLFVRLTPVDASSISLKSDLQGRIGECDATIDERRGSVLVRDEYGTLHHLAARSAQPILRNQAVLLVEYQPGGDYFQVQAWNE